MNNDVVDIPNKDKMIKDLEKTLRKACKAYYNGSNLLMTDEEFDHACVLYRKLTGNFFNTKTKPNKNKRLVNVSHGFEKLQGTIDYKFPNLNEFKDWLTTIFNNLNLSLTDELALLVSLKYDGNSVAIEYVDGKTDIALTRGDNGEGADLTDIFINDTIDNVSDIKERIAIKYEAILTYEDYEKLNAIKSENGENIYANPRSTVSGLLGRNDSAKYRKYISLVPLSIRIKDKELTRKKEIDLMDKFLPDNKIKFKYFPIKGDFNTIIEKVTKLYDKYTTKRYDLDFMIDGLVIEVVKNSYKKQLGYFASDSPKWTCALKFPYMEKETTVTDIKFEASPNGTGKITPLVYYEPVEFNGAIQTKTSLANYKRFKELNLGKGSKVMIQYRNDCLSYCLPLDKPENKNIKPIPFTDRCPACKGKVRIHKNDDKNEETFVFCDNPNCYMKLLGKINNYTNQVGIKGIDIKTLGKIAEAGLLKTPADLYRLNYRQLRVIPGLGDKSALNIVESIRENTPNDYDVLAGLGISNLGRDTAKIILNEMSFDSLADPNYVNSAEFETRLGNLEGIGPIMKKRIPKELSENSYLLNDLLTNVKFKTTKRIKLDNQLIFVMTGDPNTKYFPNRDAVKQYIENKGHKMTGSVSGKTNYLITETPNSNTVKNKKARELQSKGNPIKIITCEELKDLLN
jgi:DNA ligase (NAD+)